MTCPITNSEIADYLDEAADFDVASVDRHLSECRRCTARVMSFLRLRESIETFLPTALAWCKANAAVGSTMQDKEPHTVLCSIGLTVYRAAAVLAGSVTGALTFELVRSLPGVQSGPSAAGIESPATYVPYGSPSTEDGGHIPGWQGVTRGEVRRGDKVAAEIAVDGSSGMVRVKLSPGVFQPEPFAVALSNEGSTPVVFAPVEGADYLLAVLWTPGEFSGELRFLAK